MGILSRCSSNSFIHASFYNVKLMHGLRAGCSSDTKSADPRQIQICKSIVDALWMWIRSLPMKTGRGLSNSYPYRALMIKLGTLSWTLGKIADFLFECPPRAVGQTALVPPSRPHILSRSLFNLTSGRGRRSSQLILSNDKYRANPPVLQIGRALQKASQTNENEIIWYC